MSLIRTVLYSILFLCTIWFAIVFFGPFFVTKYVSNNYQDNITVEKITISPLLKLFVNKGELRFSSKNNEDLRAEFRGLNLGLSFSKAKIKLNLSLNTVNVAENGSFQKILISIVPASLLNWDNVDIELKIEAVNDIHAASIKNFTAEGQWLPGEAKIRETSFNIERLSANGENAVSIDNLEGFLDFFLLNKSLLEQSNKLDFEADELQIDNGSAHIYSIRGVVQNSEGSIKIIAKSDDVKAFNELFSSDAGFLELSTNTGLSPSNVVVQLKLENVASEKLGIDLSFVDLTAERIKHILDISLTGDISNFELSLGSQYIGALSNSKFNLEAEIEKFKNSASIGSSASVVVYAFPSISSKADMSAKITDYPNWGTCFSKSCNLDKILVNYMIRAENAELAGNINCPDGLCFSGRANHTVATNDTAIFFKNLSDAKIVNPVILSWLFGVFSQGEKVGSGHKLNFQ